MITRRTLTAMLATAAVNFARAQDAPRWPDRPVRVIVPYAPGATNDLLGRLVAASLSDQLGQPFVVENRSGAQAIVGTEFVARAKPDGHTLLIGASGPVVFNPALIDLLPYDTLRDLTPVSLLVSFPLVLVVGRDSPVRDVAALGAALRALPAPANYASSASSFQLATELFLQRVGARGQMVAYRGASESVNAVAARDVDFALVDTAAAATAIQAGRVRALAITAPDRHAAIPDVPTTAEAGLPDFQVSFFSGVLLPADTPGPVVERLHAALLRAVAEPEFRRRLDTLMMVPVASTPEAFRRTIEAEIPQWREVARAAGIRLER